MEIEVETEMRRRWMEMERRQERAVNPEHTEVDHIS
jgi:hypothetical protein